MTHPESQRNSAHEMETYKQPLMNPPLFTLVPVQSMHNPSMGCWPSSWMASNPGGYYNGPPQKSFRRGSGYDDMYRRRSKSCCSCWRCSIAMIILLTILGVAAAITGIVFITLIGEGILGPNAKNDSTTTTSSPPVAFDLGPVSIPTNGTDVDVSIFSVITSQGPNSHNSSNFTAISAFDVALIVNSVNSSSNSTGTSVFDVELAVEPSASTTTTLRPDLSTSTLSILPQSTAVISVKLESPATSTVLPDPSTLTTITEPTSTDVNVERNTTFLGARTFHHHPA